MSEVKHVEEIKEVVATAIGSGEGSQRRKRRTRDRISKTRQEEVMGITGKDGEAEDPD